MAEDSMYSDSNSMYDSEWGEYEPDEEDIAPVESEQPQIEAGAALDSAFDFSSFFENDSEDDDFFGQIEDTPETRSWLPESTPASINSMEEQEMYKLAKAWYTGDPNYADDKVPHPEAGNRITAGTYANMALKKFKRTGDWKIALGAPEGANNKIDTPTQLKSSAIGRLQIIKSTREAAYKALGIPPNKYAEAERMYTTDPDFQSQVEEAVKGSFMKRIRPSQFGQTEDRNTMQEQMQDQLIYDFQNREMDIKPIDHQYAQQEINMPDLTSPEFANNPGNYQPNTRTNLNSAEIIRGAGEIYNEIKDFTKQNGKNVVSAASSTIDAISNGLGEKQNLYNLREFNRIKNRGRFIKNTNTSNNVPTYV